MSDIEELKNEIEKLQQENHNLNSKIDSQEQVIFKILYKKTKFGILQCLLYIWSSPENT